MAIVVLDFSMSLDGFVAGPNVSTKLPMGEDGMRLHEWLFAAEPNAVDAEAGRMMRETTGAVVLGRRTFDVGVGEWNDTPFPVPCFVVTHNPLEERIEKSGTFTFVDDLEHALHRAKAAAGEKHVRVMGVEVARQSLEAGFVEEIGIQLVPVLLGDGLRLFENLGTEHIELERESALESPQVTHLRFRVVQAR